MSNTTRSRGSKGRFVDFKEIKQQVPILEVLRHYDLLHDLKEKGDRLSGCCPICQGDNNTQFRVSLEKNCFKCFSCDAGGNMLDFVRLIEKCSIREAALQVADWFGLSTEPPDRRAGPRKAATGARSAKRAVTSAASKVQEQPQEPLAKPNSPLRFDLELDFEHPWFEEIGLEEETIEEFGLGYCSRGTMRGCIAFPVHNCEGELVAYVGLNPEATSNDGENLWRYPGAKHFQPELEIFNFHRVETGSCDERLLLAADPLEVVQLWQLGERNVVCLLANELPKVTLQRLTNLVD